MRFIYMDEAGTSQKEARTIVVGLIVNPDTQLMLAETAIKEVLGSVPAQFREGFVFHAADVWGSRKYRPDWSQSDRLRLLKGMMSLPRRLEIPIAYGMVSRNSIPSPTPKLTDAQYHHFNAFAGCIAHADAYLRNQAGLSEVGSVVAEDVPEMRKYLRQAARIWRDKPQAFSADSAIPTAEEKRLGYVKQNSELRVTRVRSNVLFVEKDEDPLTQLADAVAFGFRRYFCEQSFGSEFIRAILDHEPHLPDYAGGASYGSFNPRDSG